MERKRKRPNKVEFQEMNTNIGIASTSEGASQDLNTINACSSVSNRRTLVTSDCENGTKTISNRPEDIQSLIEMKKKKIGSHRRNKKLLNQNGSIGIAEGRSQEDIEADFRDKDPRPVSYPSEPINPWGDDPHKFPRYDETRAKLLKMKEELEEIGPVPLEIYNYPPMSLEECDQTFKRLGELRKIIGPPDDTPHPEDLSLQIIGRNVWMHDDPNDRTFDDPSDWIKEDTSGWM